MNICTNRNAASKGFTLVELSIVLIIIGLIAASITTGSKLIHSSKLRTVTADSNNYRIAYNLFKQQYMSIPGDMPNAFDYWGAAAGCTNETISGAKLNACNGNGNTRINGSYVYIPRAESNLAWRFLALSGMVPGAYAGGAATAIGQAMPPAKYDPTVGVSFAYAANYSSYADSASADSIVIPSVKKNFLIFGKLDAFSATVGGFLSPIDAYNLDKKTDDGIPTTGLFLAYTGKPGTGSEDPAIPVAHTCTIASPYNGYIFTHNVPACAIMVALD